MIKSNSFKTEVVFSNIPTFPDFSLSEVTEYGRKALKYESVIYASQAIDGSVVVFGQVVRDIYALVDGLITEESMRDCKRRFFDKCVLAIEYSTYMPGAIVPESEGRTAYQETVGHTKIPEYILKELKPNNE